MPTTNDFEWRIHDLAKAIDLALARMDRREDGQHYGPVRDEAAVVQGPDGLWQRVRQWLHES